MGKSIIEKLGIRRLEIFSTISADGNIKVRFADLLEKETIFNEMLEALIENEIHVDNCGKGWDHYKNIDIIQKACHPLKWPEIKEIIK